MHYTLAQDSGQASGSAPVDAAMARFPWEAEPVSGAVEQDTWLVSFIDILTLLLTLFVLLLIHQDEVREPARGAEPPAEAVALEQLPPAPVPVDLTALSPEAVVPQIAPGAPEAPATQADTQAEQRPEPTAADPAAHRDLPAEATQPAPLTEPGAQTQPEELLTDLPPVKSSLLSEPFAAPSAAGLPGLVEAEPSQPGLMDLLLAALETAPQTLGPLSSEQDAPADEPVPPAEVAAAGEAREMQTEELPAQAPAGPDAGEDALASVSPAASLLAVFRDGALADRIDVSVHPGGVNLEISDSILFAPASAALTIPGLALLQELAEALRVQPYRVAVEGHTDDVPIATTRFPSNWELSSARAAIVTRYLIEQGISPERIRAIGYADTRPRAANLTPQGRARNRRVSFVLQLPATP